MAKPAFHFAVCKVHKPLFINLIVGGKLSILHRNLYQKQGHKPPRTTAFPFPNLKKEAIKLLYKFFPLTVGPPTGKTKQ